MKIKERKSKKDIDPQTNNDSPQMYYKKTFCDEQGGGCLF